MTALVAFGLWGCGGSEFPHTYRSGCLEFQSQVPLDQAKLDHNVSAAKTILTKLGHVKDAETFCKHFSVVPIYVIEQPVWDCKPLDNGDTECRHGAYSWTKGTITLGRTTGGLMHELLHRWDIDNAKLRDHMGWDEDGYFKLDSAYQFLAADPSVVE